MAYSTIQPAVHRSNLGAYVANDRALAALVRPWYTQGVPSFVLSTTVREFAFVTRCAKNEDRAIKGACWVASGDLGSTPDHHKISAYVSVVCYFLDQDYLREWLFSLLQ